MQERIRIAIAQINCTVGDLPQNCSKIIHNIKKAEETGANIVVFPELAICGYPPEDLLLKPKFIKDNIDALGKIIKTTGRILSVVGFVDKKRDNIYNAAALIYAGKLKAVYHKILLPNYGVFDEKRYFEPGSNPLVLSYANLSFGVNICEDIWHKRGPTLKQARSQANLILNINASPYHAGRIREREKIICQQAKKNKLFIVYANLVGGQDELVFDGQSMIVNSRGEITARAQAFKEELMIADLEIASKKKNPKALLISKKIEGDLGKEIKPRKAPRLGKEEEIYRALVLGLEDYVKKNGFVKAVIGLSGGIDSSIVACIAADALGAENVVGIYMPSRYSSLDSEEDARMLAENLKVRFINFSIEGIYKMYLEVFDAHFMGLKKDITEENLQARIRGNVLMAFSNKFGWLVLACGNKSEMSTGYATLYGDMAGGFAAIKDVPKTLVYKIAKYRNGISRVIPERVFTKEPAAELKANQKDKDTLPEYELLDSILKAYIEEDRDFSTIVSLGFEKEVVRKVLSLVDRSEYKRRQSPPGIKITHKAFGRDRRMPITNGYKG